MTETPRGHDASGRARMPTDEFAARVAEPLKRPMQARPDFEQRVMRAVESASRPWWHAERRVSLAPRWIVAAAAGLVLLAGGTVGVTRAFFAPSVPAAASDTVFVVRFVLAAPEAQTVSLAGDFNGWSRTATPLLPSGIPGQWSVTLEVPGGRHEYAFVVDGERWVADPAAAGVRDEFGNESSVLSVGGSRRGT